MIDWDGLMAAPIEYVAQFPDIVGLSGGIPGAVPTKPAVIARLERDQILRKQYQQALAEAEPKFDYRLNGDKVRKLAI